MSLSQKRQELIDRISAMSAEQFNVCIGARYEYQGAFNVWLEYQEEVEYDNTISDPLPDSEILLEIVDEDILNSVRNEMRTAITKSRKSGEGLDEDGVRQDVFLEAFRKLLLEDLLATHEVTEAMYDDIAAMDEEVYGGHLSWSSVTGAGKDLDQAERTTHSG